MNSSKIESKNFSQRGKKNPAGGRIYNFIKRLVFLFSVLSAAQVHQTLLQMTAQKIYWLTLQKSQPLAHEPVSQQLYP
jgi:hypothetical protein